MWKHIPLNGVLPGRVFCFLFGSACFHSGSSKISSLIDCMYLFLHKLCEFAHTLGQAKPMKTGQTDGQTSGHESHDGQVTLYQLSDVRVTHLDAQTVTDWLPDSSKSSLTLSYMLVCRGGKNHMDATGRKGLSFHVGWVKQIFKPNVKTTLKSHGSISRQAHNTSTYILTDNLTWKFDGHESFIKWLACYLQLTQLQMSFTFSNCI